LYVAVGAKTGKEEIVNFIAKYTSSPGNNDVLVDEMRHIIPILFKNDYPQHGGQLSKGKI